MQVFSPFFSGKVCILLIVGVTLSIRKVTFSNPLPVVANHNVEIVYLTNRNGYKRDRGSVLLLRDRLYSIFFIRIITEPRAFRTDPDTRMEFASLEAIYPVAG